VRASRGRARRSAEREGKSGPGGLAGPGQATFSEDPLDFEDEEDDESDDLDSVFVSVFVSLLAFVSSFLAVSLDVVLVPPEPERLSVR
jgi:hypothetical protein